ncbi:MAG: hypothetical protein JF586_01115 [Burkholderiales bacterium]|nr:hypothetical protein [Burkholderiales bacterium]
MSDGVRRRRAPTGRALAVGLAVALAWVGWGLARHPGFQPVAWLRVAAPVIALLAGGGFTRLVARARADADARREFDRGGKALFMGFAMVAATLLSWLLVSQAAPATWTALAGAARTEAGVVTRRVPETGDGDCRFRLVVVSADAAGAVPRPLDECVDEAVWKQAADGGPVSLQVVRSALGADLAGVGAAGAAR